MGGGHGAVAANRQDGADLLFVQLGHHLGQQIIAQGIAPTAQRGPRLLRKLCQVIEGEIAQGNPIPRR